MSEPAPEERQLDPGQRFVAIAFGCVGAYFGMKMGVRTFEYFVPPVEFLSGGAASLILCAIVVALFTVGGGWLVYKVTISI